MRGVAIGAGYFSPFHYEAWTRIPEVEIVAMSDRAEDKAASIMAQYGVPRSYAGWREMIDREQPDLVDIITPPDTHEEMCRYAAERGVHIICQKPLAPSYEISRRIVECARTAGVRLMVHENFRWQPWYRGIKQIQNDGIIGDSRISHFRCGWVTARATTRISRGSRSSGTIQSSWCMKPAYTSSTRSAFFSAKSSASSRSFAA